MKKLASRLATQRKSLRKFNLRPLATSRKPFAHLWKQFPSCWKLDSHIQRTGMLVRNFKKNPQDIPICCIVSVAWILTPGSLPPSKKHSLLLNFYTIIACAKVLNIPLGRGVHPTFGVKLFGLMYDSFFGGYMYKTHFVVENGWEGKIGHLLDFSYWVGTSVTHDVTLLLWVI